MTRIERVLEIVPTPRWSDYRFWIDALTEDELIVRGEGATYGDGPTRRTYTIVDYAGDESMRQRRSPGCRGGVPAASAQRAEAPRRRRLSDTAIAESEVTHNVVSGHFASSTQLDWAVLCSVNGDSSVRIFWGGLASCPEFGMSFRDSGAMHWNCPHCAGALSSKRCLCRREALARESDLQLSAPVHEGLQARYCESGKWIDLEPIP
jgi:hypothetical protein